MAIRLDHSGGSVVDQVDIVRSSVPSATETGNGRCEGRTHQSSTGECEDAPGIEIRWMVRG